MTPISLSSFSPSIVLTRAVEENIPLDRLDWGMAGLVNTTETQGSKVIKVKWDHWIDSRSATEYSDEGVWYPQCNGDVLEKGVMLNPDTGKDTDYEEVWKYLDPFPKAMPDQVKAVTLQMNKGEQERGLMVRLGRFCQSLVRRGEKIAGERWEWSEEDGWKKLITIGEDILPCTQVLVENLPWTVGDVVQVGGNDSWKVIEISR